MAYVIVILALGLILGPLVAAMPRPRDREIARLRAQAAARGIVVSLRELPDIPPRFRFTPPEHLACYTVVLPRHQRAELPRGLFVRTGEGWQTREVGGAVPALLDQLPGGVVVVAVEWDQVRAWWDERGGDTALDPLALTLEAWSQSVTT